MTGTAKGSLALYTEVGALIAPNGSGQVMATILAGVFNDIIASYPNTTDGLGGYSTIGTVTSGTWNGSLIGLAYGGTNANLTANIGGIIYSTASAAAILAGTSTAQQMLMSGASAAPSWSTTTWPTTLAANRILYGSASNAVSGLATANGGIVNTNSSGVPSVTATPLLGVPGTTGGTLSLAGSGSGQMTLAASATAGGVTFTFPNAAGTSGQLMQAGGGGALGWTTSVFPSGAVAQYSLLYASSANTWAALATNVGGVLNTNGLSVPSITATPAIGKNGTIGGSITLNGFTSGSATIGVAAAAGTVIFNLPTTNGTGALVGDGAGNLSYLATVNNGVFATNPSGTPSITATPTLGGSGTGGSLTLNGSSSGSAAIGVKNSAGTTTFILPVGNGTSGQFLQGDGSGNLSYGTPSIAPPPQGRLSLATATPVMTATLSAQGTIYYTPYIGNIIPLWNGSGFVPTVFTELTNILANSSTGNAGPAAATFSSAYDLFVWNNAGTPTLTRGPAWTSSTSRSAGTQLQPQTTSGILVNFNSITNGPNAGYGTYVGTIYTDGSAKANWIIGGNNTAGVLNVWNMYNRVSAIATVTDTEIAYTYTTATYRQAGGLNYNNIAFFVGVQEDAINSTLSTNGSLIAFATTSPVAFNSIGLNSSSTSFGPSQRVSNGSSNTISISSNVSINTLPQLGLSTVYALESGDGTHANTFNSNTNNLLTLTVRA